MMVGVAGMVRTGVLQEIRVMRFEEIHDRFYRDSLSATSSSQTSLKSLTHHRR